MKFFKDYPLVIKTFGTMGMNDDSSLYANNHSCCWKFVYM